MASDEHFVTYIVDQIQNSGQIAYKKMFGEYAIYCDGKVVALVCDNQLFVKPTQNGQKFIGTVKEAPPYPKAKNYYLICDQLDDKEWMCKLIQITADELPVPKAKSKKKK